LETSYVFGLVAIAAEGLPQSRNVNCQIIFFDKRIRPDAADEFLFAHQAPAVLDQHQQELERFGSDRHGLAGAKQNAIRNVETEGAKFVRVGGRALMMALRIPS